MESIMVAMKDYPGNKNITVISVKGHLDFSTAPALEDNLRWALNDKKFNLIIELKDVAYIASAGWGVFISMLKNIRVKKGDLVLAGMKPAVSGIFELLEFNTILKSFPSVESAALTAFKKSTKAAGA